MSENQQNQASEDLPQEEIQPEKNTRLNKAKQALIAKGIAQGMSKEEAETWADEQIDQMSKVHIDEQAKEAEASIREFDYDFLQFYMNEAFLATISRKVTKVTDSTMPTAYMGVRKNGKNHEMIMGINPVFFKNLPKEQRQGVIKHELYHLVFQHVTTRNPADPEDAKLWNFGCFLPGTLLSDGTPIEQATKEMETYGQSGKISVKTPMHRPYEGYLHNIQAGGMTYTATNEHPFRVVRRKNNNRPIQLDDPEWVKAENIQKGDYVVIPKLPKSFNDKTVSLKPFVQEGLDSKGRDTFGNRVPSMEFPINEETAWFLGLYTAEGSGKNCVSIALGSHETDLIEKTKHIANRLEYNVSIKLHHENNSCTDINFGGPVIAKALKAWCGDGSHNKRVPEFILFHQDENIIKSYLQGLVDGDGWTYQNKNRNRITIGHQTSSRLLSSHVRLLLAKLGIGFSGTNKPQRDRYIKERFIEGGGESYRINWTWEPSITKRTLNGVEINSYSHSWKDVGEGIAIPVNEVSTEYYEGPVYNIETSDHTYIINGALVHNCDLSINSIIGEESLPRSALIPGRAPLDPKTGEEMQNKVAEFIKHAEKMHASDYYFEELKRIQEEEQDGDGGKNAVIMSGMDTIDEHGMWGDLPEDVKEQLKNKVHNWMEDAARDAQRTNSWGSVPQEIQDVINAMVSREVDWRAVLQNFLGTCRSMDRISTIKKLNKKLPYVWPGEKRKYIAKFACFIDQSGSMSDEDIAMLFGELENFAKETEIDVFHFDTEVDERSHTKWRKGQPHPSPHRTRSGGTDFQPIADFCNRRENRGKWSGVVILTDGYAPGMGQIVGAKRMWVITQQGTKNHVNEGDLVVQMGDNKGWERF